MKKRILTHTINFITCIFAFNFHIGYVLAVGEIKDATKPIDIEINRNLDKGKLLIFKGDENPLISFNIDIARTVDEKRIGLMNVKNITDDYGMFFIFDREHILSFWMKDTYIPLDIIYISNSGNIISIAKNNRPFSLKGISSKKPARYVLEINAGLSEKLSIKEGDKVKIMFNKN